MASESGLSGDRRLPTASEDPQDQEEVTHKITRNLYLKYHLPILGLNQYRLFSIEDLVIFSILNAFSLSLGFL